VTEIEIAAEKLAVLRELSTLVVGRVSPEVLALAEQTAAERGAKLVLAPEDPGEGLELSVPGAFQRRNFALAMAVVEAFQGPLDPDRVAGVAANLTIPGRLERVAEGPPTYLDAAHNPDGARALAEALEELGLRTGVVACLAILEDKDAEGIVEALAPVLERAICTEAAAARRPTPAAELARLCEAVGLPAEPEPDFEAALRRARSLAAGPPEKTLLVTGSHYVLGPARSALA
jgi:dihydrofolate synthase/folylpolyglutamate synthase